jgi:heme/copper-type cytochrome/quinol oxidase subunit 2
LLLRMGAGLAAAGRPLGATVEVRLQQHGARRVEEQCQNDTVQILFFLIIIIIIIIIIYIFFYLWGPKNGLQKKHVKKNYPLHSVGISLCKIPYVILSVII